MPSTIMTPAWHPWSAWEEDPFDVLDDFASDFFRASLDPWRAAGRQRTGTIGGRSQRSERRERGERSEREDATNPDRRDTAQEGPSATPEVSIEITGTKTALVALPSVHARTRSQAKAEHGTRVPW